jgi:hypothetical protein
MAPHNAAQGVATSKGNASARVNRVDGTDPSLTSERLPVRLSAIRHQGGGRHG